MWEIKDKGNKVIVQRDGWRWAEGQTKLGSGKESASQWVRGCGCKFCSRGSFDPKSEIERILCRGGVDVEV